MLEITTLIKVEHYGEKILFTEEALQAYKDEYFKWRKEYPTFASITNVISLKADDGSFYKLKELQVRR